MLAVDAWGLNLSMGEEALVASPAALTEAQTEGTMGYLIKTTVLLLLSSAAVMVGCELNPMGAARPADEVEAEEPDACDDAGDDADNGDGPTEVDCHLSEVELPLIPPGQDRIRATDGRYLAVTGNCKNPEVRLVRDPRPCEKSHPRRAWIFAEFGNLTRIRSAFCGDKCLTFSGTLSEPVDIVTCSFSNDQLLTIAPPPEDDDRICSLSNLCVTYLGRKAFAATFASAPGWYRESC